MPCEHIAITVQNGKDWIDYLSALLTPTIAIFGSYIAYRQWKTENNRLKHELFERRYSQFESIRDFLGLIICTGTSTKDAVSAFLKYTRGMRFTYDKEISDYIDTLSTSANRLSILVARANALETNSDEYNLNQNEQTAIKRMLLDEFNQLEDKFARYLEIRH